MHSRQEFQNSLSRTISRAATAALAIAVVLVLTVILSQAAPAQTYHVLHNFSNGTDGEYPSSGLTLDAAGNLYGTTCGGAVCAGTSGNGTVFELSNNGSGWVFMTLYTFPGGSDGAGPRTRVIPVQSTVVHLATFLYGTTFQGGDTTNGTVFNLRPSASVLGGWKETVLYSFQGSPDGAYPEIGDLIFHYTGLVGGLDIFGTTAGGGSLGGNCIGFALKGCGSVFRRGPGEGPRLYSFTGGGDGATPYGTLIFDQAGNLYGTAFAGGSSNPSGCVFYQGCGTVFELTPKYINGTWIWTENTLYGFGGGADGGNPVGGVIFGSHGYLYGSASWGGSNGGGTVFELTPSGPHWIEHTLYSFTGTAGCGPWGTLVMDQAGNLYGTTFCDGAHGLGNVFKLTPSGMYTSLHDFSGSDGEKPYSNVIIDANGNLYGTTWKGGTSTACPEGCGVVWKITP